MSAGRLSGWLASPVLPDAAAAPANDATAESASSGRGARVAAVQTRLEVQVGQEYDARANPSQNDWYAVELGVKFRSDTSGYVTGIRFYKGTANTGTHVGRLWSSAGALLAQATFVDETASGWQQVNFDSPVAITANTTYVASYHTNVGGLRGRPERLFIQRRGQRLTACAGQRRGRSKWHVRLQRQ